MSCSNVRNVKITQKQIKLTTSN